MSVQSLPRWNSFDRGTSVAVVGLAVCRRMRSAPRKEFVTQLGPGREEANVAKEDRGFASMDRAKQREIASKGGKAAHQKGTAHEWTSEEARDAGRKGGIASHQRRREQLGGGSADDTGLTDSDTTGNASAESMRRSDSVSGSSSSPSSMEDSRDDYWRRDGWSRDD
jgi:uncharacterized protein